MSLVVTVNLESKNKLINKQKLPDIKKTNYNKV